MAKKKYYQRPDGLYEAIRMIKGKRVAFRGHSCREVDRKIAEYHETTKHGRPFPVVADEWEEEHEQKVGEASRENYKYAVRRLKEAFTGTVGNIRPLDIKRYISRMEAQGYAGATVRKELSVLRMIFAHAVLAGDIDVNPVTEVHPSRGLPRTTREALTEAQEAIVRDSWDKTPFGLFALLLLFTGLRRGEALALTYADIDRQKGVIHINKKLNYAYGETPRLEGWTKTENGMRDVPLLKPLADAIPDYHVGLLFPGKDGGYMRKGEIRRTWQRYCREAGLAETVTTDAGETVTKYPITPHCFRHSFATICYEAGLDVRQAAKIFGDTPEVLDEVYTHLREDCQRSAADKLTAYFGAV